MRTPGLLDAGGGGAAGAGAGAAGWAGRRLSGPASKRSRRHGRAASAASKAADYLLAFQRDLPLTSATADAHVGPLDISYVAKRRAAA